MTRAFGIFSFSQFGEDVWVLDNAINSRRVDITCVEVGAFDGVSYSNTLLLELLLGARSILIEPSPRNAKKARALRPNAIVYEAAVTVDGKPRNLLGSSSVAGLTENLSSSYLKDWNLEKVIPIRVDSRRMADFIQEAELSYVDFLSIDVQGGEIDVLRSNDWGIPVGLVCIELEGQDPGRDKLCRNILIEKGFEFRARMGVSEMWANPDYFRWPLLFHSKSRLKTPPLHPFRSGDWWRTGASD